MPVVRRGRRSRHSPRNPDSHSTERLASGLRCVARPFGLRTSESRRVFVLDFGRPKTVPPRPVPTRAARAVAARAPAVLPAVREAARADGPKALGALLRDRGLLTEAQLEAAIARQQQTGRRLGHVLVELGHVTPEAVLEALSLQLGMPTVRINAFTVNTDALGALPEKAARRHTAFPMRKVGTTLVVALASPKDLNALDDLRFACGGEIQTALALEHEIVEAIDRYYRDEWMPAAPDDRAASVRI